MQVPTIHLNGTSKENLLEGVQRALQSICVALDQLYAVSPNARDYYPQGEHAFARACKEHEARIAQLVVVRNELTELAEAIADGGHR